MTNRKGNAWPTTASIGRLWTGLHVPGEGNGDPRSTDLAWVAMAKCLRGALDWQRATRVSRSDVDLWRGALAANSFFLRGVLQSGAHAPGLGQRHAAGSGSPAVRRHSRHTGTVTAAVTPSNLSLLSSDRRVQLPSAGNIIAFPEVGGLHHRYERGARNIGETTRYLSLPSITPN
jgi:hypothetical protein